MALTQCPECHKEISDKADMCPHCGFKLNLPPSASLSPFARFLIRMVGTAAALYFIYRWMGWIK